MKTLTWGNKISNKYILPLLILGSFSLFTSCGKESISTNSGFSPVPDSKHCVTLNWVKSISTGVSGYNLYRSSQSGGPYALVGSVDSATTTFLDLNVTAGATYFYAATAFVANPASESIFSNESTAVIPSP